MQNCFDFYKLFCRVVTGAFDECSGVWKPHYTCLYKHKLYAFWQRPEGGKISLMVNIPTIRVNSFQLPVAFIRRLFCIDKETIMMEISKQVLYIVLAIAFIKFVVALGSFIINVCLG